nr:pseudouridine synthase [uncultured Carboxylicivirga sp.]
MHSNLFKQFQADISKIDLPDQFPFPFTNEPHQLCRLAALELMKNLSQQSGWNQIFGLTDNEASVGKMFGVLVVQDSENNVGYLSGFSGAIDGCNNYTGFVPPVYDLLNPQGFFKIGEQNLSQINTKINQLENSIELSTAKNELKLAKTEFDILQTSWKNRLKNNKTLRKTQRINAQDTKEGKELEQYLDELNRASQLEKIAFKKAMAEQKSIVESIEKQIHQLIAPIEELKLLRKNKSAQLQRDIFHHFQLLNSKEERITVTDIFHNMGEEFPPAGAGDCAGPKLLQFAFQHQLKPIALAEFWWGKSPKSEVRKHKHFYPPCRSKCVPIMQHMLKHFNVADDPMASLMKAPDDLEIIFEDQWLMVVNKPEQFLSVPGKEISDSVYQRIKQMRPEAEGPLLVHRLDMATSGLLLIAKDSQTHKALQSQFIKRTTQKRYVALLDGIIEKDNGTIDLPLRVDLDNRPQQLVCYEYGKSARTHWQVINRKNGNTRVYFYPVTGRTHQLRVHAAHFEGLNCPIVGDALYGQASNRLYLHADWLEITHPQTEKRISFSSPAPF